MILISKQNISIIPILLCFLMLISTPLSAQNRTKAPALSAITVQLKWKHQFQFAGYYAAIEKGFYRDAGFEVRLKEAAPMLDPIKEVLSGRADYGVANSELMLYRQNGEPVTALAAFIQHSPIVIMSLKHTNINSPQDIIGKKLMYPDGYYGANTRGILLNEGVALTQFESVPLSFNIDDLIDGHVDAMVAYVTDQPYQLQKKNIQYNLIDPRNYGIDFYGDTLFTLESRVNDKPDEVALFRSATIKGWQYAIQHPDELIEIIINQYHSERSRDELQYEAKETIQLIVPKLVDMGNMNPGRWKHIADTFVDLNMTTGTFQDDGFIYVPEKEKANRTLRLFTRVALSLAVVAIVSISILFYFNKKLKKAVAEKTLYLERSNKVKDEFLATISHELRTPMNGIINAMQLIHHTDLNEEQRDLIHIASQSSNNMLALIDNILSFTEAQSGSLLLKEELFATHDVIDHLNARFRSPCDDKDISFTCVITPQVPQHLIGDKTKLQKLLGYFLDNSIKFTSHGAINLKISLKNGSESRKTKWIQCDIIDSGIGIKQDAIKDIFDAFQQADGSSSRQYGGLGIGLPIAKQVCSLMGGNIHIESIPDQGTHITIAIPMKEGDRPSRPNEVRTNLLPKDTRVLIVEDNHTNQIVLHKIMEKQGYHACIADNGQAALDIVSTYRPHIILMDCQMPIMDGYTATQKIRQLKKPTCDIPIIAVTANVMAEDRQRCLDAGMDDYLKKPTNKEVLKQRVKQWLDYRENMDFEVSS